MARTAYASRAQLLERCNLLRLAQLAAPTGTVMPPVDQVRAALLELAREPLPEPEAEAALGEAVAAVDTALADGADLMRSHGLPLPGAWGEADVVPPVLVRVNCALAMHYLGERAGTLAESESAGHGALLKLLQRHASGEVALVQTPQGQDLAGAEGAGVAFVQALPARYGLRARGAEPSGPEGGL